MKDTVILEIKHLPKNEQDDIKIEFQILGGFIEDLKSGNIRVRTKNIDDVVEILGLDISYEKSNLVRVINKANIESNSLYVTCSCGIEKTIGEWSELSYCECGCNIEDIINEN